MEDVKELQSKKKTKKRTSTSSVKKSKVTKKVSNISNEELLEQILNKKKSKKSSTKKVSGSTESVKVSTKKTTPKKTKQFNELENDFIYDQIKNSKKKTKKTTPKKVEEEKVVQKKEEPKVEEKKVEVKEEKYDTYNSLEESVKRKKEVKDDFQEFITEIENDKLLKQIKEALARDEVEYVQPDYKDKVSGKDVIETIDNQINERLKDKAAKLPKKKTTNKTTKLVVRLVLFILVCIGMFFLVNGIIKEVEYQKEQERLKEEERKRIEEENRLKKLYNECLVRPLDENDTSEEIDSYVSELNKYIRSKYEMSVMYEDLTYGFTYSYNDSKSYYAASTIKSLGAIYVYEMAYKGEIDLDDTMKYTSKYYRGASKGMKNHKYGDNVKLRDLVKYSVIYSDNTAHNMIVNYVGVNKLRAYGKELGANLTHLNGDLYGYIDLSDANIYMKKLYDVINNTGEYGKELEKYFLEAEQNGLEIPDDKIKAAHKYGEYEYFYHDIGIVYTEEPYIVAILTHEGRHDFQAIIKDINGRVYKLHNLYYKNRENYCTTTVYGK